MKNLRIAIKDLSKKAVYTQSRIHEYKFKNTSIDIEISIIVTDPDNVLVAVYMTVYPENKSPVHIETPIYSETFANVAEARKAANELKMSVGTRIKFPQEK